MSPGLRLKKNGSPQRELRPRKKAHELTEADQTHDENVKSTLVKSPKKEQKRKINDLIRQAEVYYLYGDGVPAIGSAKAAAELYNAAGDLGSP